MTAPVVLQAMVASTWQEAVGKLASMLELAGHVSLAYSSSGERFTREQSEELTNRWNKLNDAVEEFKKRMEDEELYRIGV